MNNQVQDIGALRLTTLPTKMEKTCVTSLTQLTPQMMTPITSYGEMKLEKEEPIIFKDILNSLEEELSMLSSNSSEEDVIWSDDEELESKLQITAKKTEDFWNLESDVCLNEEEDPTWKRFKDRYKQGLMRSRSPMSTSASGSSTDEASSDTESLQCLEDPVTGQCKYISSLDLQGLVNPDLLTILLKAVHFMQYGITHYDGGMDILVKKTLFWMTSQEQGIRPVLAFCSDCWTDILLLLQLKEVQFPFWHDVFLSPATLIGTTGSPRCLICTSKLWRDASREFITCETLLTGMRKKMFPSASI